jgi:hypothetical protein
MLHWIDGTYRTQARCTVEHICVYKIEYNAYDSRCSETYSKTEYAYSGPHRAVADGCAHALRRTLYKIIAKGANTKDRY